MLSQIVLESALGLLCISLGSYTMYFARMKRNQEWEHGETEIRVWSSKWFWLHQLGGLSIGFGIILLFIHD